MASWAVTKEKLDTLHLMPGEGNTPQDNLLKAVMKVNTIREKKNLRNSQNGPQDPSPGLQHHGSDQKQPRRVEESWASCPCSQTSGDYKDRLARFDLNS